MHLLDGRGCTPRLFHLGRIGRDADDVGPILTDKILYRAILHIRIEDHYLVAAAFTYRAEVGKTQMGGRTRIDGQAKFGINQQNAHWVSPINRGIAGYAASTLPIHARQISGPSSRYVQTN